MPNPLFARLARFAGGKALDHAVERVFPVGKGASLGKGLAGVALARIATRSVPGAILIGGGMLAKLLYDRRRAQPVAPPVETPGPMPASDDDDHHVLG